MDRIEQGETTKFVFDQKVGLALDRVEQGETTKFVFKQKVGLALDRIEQGETTKFVFQTEGRFKLIYISFTFSVQSGK